MSYIVLTELFKNVCQVMIIKIFDAEYFIRKYVFDFSGSFLRRQLSIDNYHVKKYVKESQFLLFSRQKVYKNAKFDYITEILWRTFWRDHFLTL